MKIILYKSKVEQEKPAVMVKPKVWETKAKAKGEKEVAVEDIAEVKER